MLSIVLAAAAIYAAPAPAQACFELLPNRGPVHIFGYDHHGAQKGPKLKTTFRPIGDAVIIRERDKALVDRCAPRKRKA